MTRGDIDTAVEWAAIEGWNPGLSDAGSFWAADPRGFYIGRLDGEPATCISAVQYGDAFGFVGFYICRPEFRGKGFGLKTWEHAFANLRAATIGLDGVVDQQANYAKSGFSLAHRNIRYGGEDVAVTGTASGVSELGPEHAAAVAAYDRAHFGCGRPEFLSSWLGTDGHVALGAMNDGGLKGYGVARPCRSGVKIGPLFADHPATAECLFDRLAAKASGRPLFFDVPEPNSAAVRIAESRGLEPVFETARMYRCKEWELPLDRIFGITTFELG